MALTLNQLKMTPRNGAYVYMPNVPQPHNCIVSANQATALTAGAILTLDTAATNTNCPVVKAAAVTDPIYGVIPYDSLKNSYKAKDKVMAAVEGSTLYFIADGAITQGAVLCFTAAGKVTKTQTATYSTIGVAETAAADGAFVQVKLKFGTVAGE